MLLKIFYYTRKYVKYILAVLCCIVICVVVAEFIIEKTNLSNRVDRVINPEPFTATINEQGFRVKFRNITYEKETNENFRIICLGDSFTFGHGVSDDETYPVFLEASLNNIYKKKIQVINAGVCGAQIASELDFYNSNCLRFRHHLVILLYDIHQGDIRQMAMDKLSDEQGWSENWSFDKLLKKTKVYALIKHKMIAIRNAWMVNFLASKEGHKYFLEKKDEYLKGLKELADLVHSNDAKLVFVIVKHDSLGEIDYGDFCKKEGIIFIDLTQEYIQKAKQENLLLQAHFNKRGNLFLAEAIANKLVSYGITLFPGSRGRSERVSRDGKF